MIYFFAILILICESSSKQASIAKQTPILHYQPFFFQTKKQKASIYMPHYYLVTNITAIKIRSFKKYFI
jgi:hypothetical protein